MTHDPVEDKNKTTRRMTSSDSLTVQELVNTRAKLRTVIQSGLSMADKYVKDPVARAVYLEILDDATKFLGVFVILIVPTLLIR